MSTVPQWRAEFDDRIAAFTRSIGLDEATVREVFTNLGVNGETEQSLDIIDSEQFLPMAELFAAFCDQGLVAKAKLRLAVTHLRGKTTLDDPMTQTLQKVLESTRSKNDWTDEELLLQYDDSSTEVWEVLRKRSHGRPFVVFNRDGTINQSATLRMLSIAKKQPTNSEHMIDGKLVVLYRSGDFPPTLLEESPFAAGHALVDGYCAATECNWKDVSAEARILCRLHANREKMTRSERRNLCKLATNLDELKAELPRAVRDYEEAQKNNALPSLLIQENRVTKKIDTGY